MGYFCFETFIQRSESGGALSGLLSLNPSPFPQSSILLSTYGATVLKHSALHFARAPACNPCVQACLCICLDCNNCIYCYCTEDRLLMPAGSLICTGC